MNVFCSYRSYNSHYLFVLLLPTRWKLFPPVVLIFTNFIIKLTRKNPKPDFTVAFIVIQLDNSPVFKFVCNKNQWNVLLEWYCMLGPTQSTGNFS